MTGAPGLAAPEGAAAAFTSISTAISKLSVPSMTHLVVGAAGALAAPLEATQVGDALRRAFVDCAIAVTSDAVTSHVGALGGSPGVVLAAGTGAVAVGVSATGSVHVVDGAGPWLGDEGGGTWIGLAGLRAALRANDGRAEATPLLAAARKRFGDLGGASGPPRRRCRSRTHHRRVRPRRGALRGPRRSHRRRTSSTAPPRPSRPRHVRRYARPPPRGRLRSPWSEA